MALVSYDNSDSEPEINLDKETNQEVSKKRVKIEIPHLPNFNIEEDEPSEKIIKPNQNLGSGLFNILPSPIHKPTEKKYKFEAAVVKEKNLVPRHVKMEKQNKTNDTEEEICNGNYFFSVSQTNVAIPDFFNFEANSAKPVTKDTTMKTNEYFSRLVSKTSNKKSFPKELETNSDDKVIDINSPEFKTDWKMNALKEETFSVSSTSENKDEEPSTLSKKKHQITYLAYQAKKNEELMKEQWAQNKMTRKQTQAKYGF